MTDVGGGLNVLQLFLLMEGVNEEQSDYGKHMQLWENTRKIRAGKVFSFISHNGITRTRPFIFVSDEVVMNLYIQSPFHREPQCTSKETGGEEKLTIQSNSSMHELIELKGGNIYEYNKCKGKLIILLCLGLATEKG